MLKKVKHHSFPDAVNFKPGTCPGFFCLQNTSIVSAVFIITIYETFRRYDLLAIENRLALLDKTVILAALELPSRQLKLTDLSFC